MAMKEPGGRLPAATQHPTSTVATEAEGAPKPAGKPRRRRGPKAECSACGKDFASQQYFERHFVGTSDYLWSPERPDGWRCLSTEELRAKGYEQDQYGRWRNARNAARGRSLREAGERSDVEPAASIQSAAAASAPRNGKPLLGVELNPRAGSAMKAVLAACEERRHLDPSGRWVCAEDVAAEGAGGPPSASQVESIRRAMRTLGARGLVEARHVSGRVVGRPTGRRVLAARLPLDDEERAEEAWKIAAFEAAAAHLKGTAVTRAVQAANGMPRREEPPLP